MNMRGIRELSQQWVSELNNREFNSTSEEMCLQSYAFQGGYMKGVEDTEKLMIEKLRNKLQECVCDGYFEMHEDYIEDFCKELMEE